MNSYKTKDGRWLWMVVIQPDPHWRSFCEHIGRSDLIDDAASPTSTPGWSTTQH